MLKFKNQDMEFEFSVLKNDENKCFIAKYIKIILFNNKYK
jgi:hypothetical protein